MAISYEVVTQSGVSKVRDMSILRSLTEEDRQGTFMLQITYGHIIRSVVHVLRDVLSYGIFVLTPNRMSLLRLDESNSVIVALDLDTSKFFHYFFLSRTGIIRIGISFNLFWQAVKVIGKQDTFIMTKSEGDDFVVLDFGNSSRQQFQIQGVCSQDVPVPLYRTIQPNICITVKELTQAMGYFRTERKKAHIKGYRDRLIVEATESKKMKKMGASYDDIWRRIGITKEQLVKVLNSDDPPICSLSLNSDHTDIRELEICKSYPKYAAGPPTVDIIQSHLILKSLAKIYTIAPGLRVLATVEADRPIRLSIPVGELGELTLYLKNNTQEQEVIAECPQEPEVELAIPRQEEEIHEPKPPKRKKKPKALEPEDEG
jgi:hypothetical protein